LDEAHVSIQNYKAELEDKREQIDSIAKRCWEVIGQQRPNVSSIDSLWKLVDYLEGHKKETSDIDQRVLELLEFCKAALKIQARGLSGDAGLDFNEGEEDPHMLHDIITKCRSELRNRGKMDLEELEFCKDVLRIAARDISAIASLDESIGGSGGTPHYHRDVIFAGIKKIAETNVSVMKGINDMKDNLGSLETRVMDAEAEVDFLRLLEEIAHHLLVSPPEDGEGPWCRRCSERTHECTYPYSKYHKAFFALQRWRNKGMDEGRDGESIMKRFRVPVKWEVSQTIEVEAASLDAALDAASQVDMPLPGPGKDDATLDVDINHMTVQVQTGEGKWRAAIPTDADSKKTEVSSQEAKPLVLRADREAKWVGGMTGVVVDEHHWSVVKPDGEPASDLPQDNSSSPSASDEPLLSPSLPIEEDSDEGSAQAVEDEADDEEEVVVDPPQPQIWKCHHCGCRVNMLGMGLHKKGCPKR